MKAVLKNYKGEALDIGAVSSQRYTIPFGKLVKGTIANSVVTESASASMVIMNDAFCMPYDRATLTFSIPSDLTAKVYYGTPDGRTGDTTHVSDSVSQSLSDGDTFIFPYSDDTEWHKEYYYRIAFVKTGIDLSEIQSLIASGDISVECDRGYEDVIMMNSDILGEADAAAWYIELGNDGADLTKKYPMIVHVSDLHSDAIRYQRSIKVAEYLGASHINTGDNVAQCAKDGFSWPYELIKDTNLLPITAQGNHDAVFMKQSDFETAFFTNWYNKYEYSRLGAYYYKDDEEKGIRYICLNSCDYEGTDSSSSYRINKISPAQQLWYAQTLLATPENYKVVVCLHQPLATIIESQQYGKFVAERDMTPGIVTSGGSNIIAITDAFISGTSITVSSTLVDFSEKEEGAEFVMYINGHLHADFIGYISGATNLQLQANICNNCIFVGQGFTYDYIPRNLGKGKLQDLMNVYVINYDEGTVSVFRVGAANTTNGRVRDKMTIPYK